MNQNFQTNYPNFKIRSKNEMYKYLLYPSKMGKDLYIETFKDVELNFNDYWKDNIKESNPNKNKFVRHAFKKNLRDILKSIHEKLLKSIDDRLPDFIFAVKNKGNKQAVENLLGKKKKRDVIKLDLKTYFEQTKQDKVISFLKHSGCNEKISKIISNICCVKTGQKGNNIEDNYNSIARGFCTSPRLSIWCNIETFIKVNRLLNKEYKKYDPRMSIYVDDINISLSRISNKGKKELIKKIYDIFEKDKMILNKEKTKVIRHNEKLSVHVKDSKIIDSKNILGIHLHRNKIRISVKTQTSLNNAKINYKKNINDKDIKKRKKGLMRYKNYIHSN